MNTEAQINEFIASQPEPKRSEMQELDQIIRQLNPDCKLWFLEGKNEEGKVVYNTNIGYGSYTIHYAGGKSREFYQIGFSPNTTGISVYIMGIENKKFLADNYGPRLGKA